MQREAVTLDPSTTAFMFTVTGTSTLYCPSGMTTVSRTENRDAFLPLFWSNTR